MKLNNSDKTYSKFDLWARKHLGFYITPPNGSNGFGGSVVVYVKSGCRPANPNELKMYKALRKRIV